MYPKSGAINGTINGILLKDTHQLKEEKNKIPRTYRYKRENPFR
jgi:hypothetical protein